LVCSWFQSLLLQVSFKTAAAGPRPATGVSIPSPSGLLQNAPVVEVVRVLGFNPFSFRSPSKQDVGPALRGDPWFQSLLLQVSFKTTQTQTSDELRVSIPSPSGLLQNTFRGLAAKPSLFQSLLLQVSFKTLSPHELWSLDQFQSLLLQVSFKTF